MHHPFGGSTWRRQVAAERMTDQMSRPGNPAIVPGKIARDAAGVDRIRRDSRMRETSRELVDEHEVRQLGLCVRQSSIVFVARQIPVALRRRRRVAGGGDGNHAGGRRLEQQLC